jgi:hypothetical protein
MRHDAQDVADRIDGSDDEAMTAIDEGFELFGSH